MERDSVWKILLSEWIVKGEIASTNCPVHPNKIADFHSKYWILNEYAKNKIKKKSTQTPLHKADSSIYFFGDTIASLPRYEI